MSMTTRDPFGWDPFQQVDRLFDRLWQQLSAGPRLAMDVHRVDDGVELCFDLPGVRPEDVDLSVERNELTVRAERRAREGESVSRERPVGTMTRRVILRDDIDADQVQARFENGTLVVHVPERATTGRRRIEITPGASGATTAIEARASEGTQTPTTAGGNGGSTTSGQAQVGQAQGGQAQGGQPQGAPATSGGGTSSGTQTAAG